MIRHAALGTLTLSGITLQGGRASSAGAAQGGCVYAPGDVSLDHVDVIGCVAMGSAGSAGGGLYVGGSLMLRSSAITGNRVELAGSDVAYPSVAGAGAWAQSVSAVDCSIGGNIASDDTCHQASGGGIYAVSGLFMRLCTVDHNSADFGGGVTAAGNSTQVVSLSTISSNAATKAGGGILTGGDLNFFESSRGRRNSLPRIPTRSERAPIHDFATASGWPPRPRSRCCRRSKYR